MFGTSGTMQARVVGPGFLSCSLAIIQFLLAETSSHSSCCFPSHIDMDSFGGNTLCQFSELLFTLYFSQLLRFLRFFLEL